MTKSLNGSSLPYIVTLVIIDIIVLYIVLRITLGWILPGTNGYSAAEYAPLHSHLSSLAMLAISYILAISIIKIRLTERGIRMTFVILRAIGQSIIFVLIFTLLCAVIFKMALRHLFAWQLLLSVAALILTHSFMTRLIRQIRKSGRNTLNILFVGGDHNNRSLCTDMKAGFGVNGYNILGFFTSDYKDKVTELSSETVLGDAHEAIEWMRQNGNIRVDELYCSLNPSLPEARDCVDELVKYCEANFIKFYYVPNMDGYLKRRMEYTRKGRVTVINLYQEPLTNPFWRAAKRLVDIAISFTFVVTVFWWLYIIIGIGVKISSPGPIFFKQKRTGYNGKSFDCLKFRSMRVSADANTKQATADDPRKTKFGDFLRRTSLDELPQFLNVLMGDMSIIGPRPHMEHHTEIYSELISDYMVRHLVRPGITGWAQINGCRGETKTLDEMKDRVEHDIWYIENWSPALDILIFFKTIIQLCGGDKQAY